MGLRMAILYCLDHNSNLCHFPPIHCNRELLQFHHVENTSILGHIRHRRHSPLGIHRVENYQLEGLRHQRYRDNFQDISNNSPLRIGQFLRNQEQIRCHHVGNKRAHTDTDHRYHSHLRRGPKESSLLGFHYLLQ